MQLIRQLFHWRKPVYDPGMPLEPQTERLLTIKDVAEQLGVTRQRVEALIKEGRLPAMKVGRIKLIKESDVELVRVRLPGYKGWRKNTQR